jgi:hypothetical protein
MIKDDQSKLLEKSGPLQFNPIWGPNEITGLDIYSSSTRCRFHFIISPGACLSNQIQGGFSNAYK